MPERNRLDESLRDIQELEEFSHRLIGHLAKVHPKAGEDVTRYAEELGLEIPAELKGAPIIWERPAGDRPKPAAGRKRTMVLVSPGNPEALELVEGGCIHIENERVGITIHRWCFLFFCFTKILWFYALGKVKE